MSRNAPPGAPPRTTPHSAKAPNSDASALMAWVLAGKRAAEQRGIAADALLREVGLDLHTRPDPMSRQSAARGLAFWQLAMRAAGDELLGVDVAMASVPMTLNALGYAFMASENLGQMYTRVARYAHVVTDACEITFTLEPHGGGRLSISGDQRLLSGVDARTAWSLFDYAMVSVVRGSRLLYGRDFAPLELRLQRPRPQSPERYEKLLGCLPVYNCEDNAVLLDAASLTRPLAYANHEVARASEEAVERHHAQHHTHWQHQQGREASGLSAQLAAVLRDLLPSGEPKQKDVCGRLGLSPRSFQRRLAEEQTTFRDVLNDTRHHLALAHLRGGQHSVSEVAFLLGFAEVSAFTRAFKRWTGSSPRAWRNQEAGEDTGTGPG